MKPKEINREAWDAAVAAERQAHAAYEDFFAAHLIGIGVSDKRYIELETEYERLVDLHRDAVDLLLQTPAPDLGALLHKLEVAREYHGLGLNGDEPANLDALIEDVRRLASRDTSAA